MRGGEEECWLGVQCLNLIQSARITSAFLFGKAQTVHYPSVFEIRRFKPEKGSINLLQYREEVPVKLDVGQSVQIGGIRVGKRTMDASYKIYTVGGLCTAENATTYPECVLELSEDQHGRFEADVIVGKKQ